MKLYKFITILIAGILLLSAKMQAQSGKNDYTDSLQVDELIAIALEQNFDIKIAKANAAIAQNNVSLGNANYLPTLSVSGGYEYSSQDTDITFASPEQPPINAQGAITQTSNASVNLDYNLFSGGSRTYTYQRLEETNYQEQLNMRADMEQVVLNVLLQFLEYTNQYYIYELDQKSVKISQSRYQKAKENYQFGVFTKLELLNAEVDLRNDSSAMLQSKLAMQKAEKQILNTLGMSPDSSLTVSADFDIDKGLNLADLQQTAFNKNAQFLLSESRIKTSELQLQQTKSNWLPRLDLTAAYRYNYQDNEAGFIQTQQTNGLNGGLQLSYTIFNGFNRSREQQNNRILMEVQQENKTKTENNLKLNLINTYKDYETALQLAALAERNIGAAQQNYTRSEEAFANGQLTGIQLREAQLNLVNSLYLLRSQRIQGKIAEANLYFYSGSLVE